MLPTLGTERLVLRPFRADDHDAFAAWTDDERYLRYLGPDHPDLDTFIARNVAVDGNTELAWVVCRAGVDAAIGSVFLDIEPTDHGAEIACLMGPESWGPRLGREAMRAVIELAFTELGVVRVWASAQEDHVASIRALESLGMQLESRGLGEGLNCAGQPFRVVVYDVLREQWR